MSVAVKLPDTGGSGWPTKTQEECENILLSHEQTFSMLINFLTKKHPEIPLPFLNFESEIPSNIRKS